jgi:hypothetical protein
MANITPPAAAGVAVFYNNGGIVVGVQYLNPASGQWEDAADDSGPLGQEKWPAAAVASVKHTYWVETVPSAGKGADPCIQQGNKLYCW